MLHVAPIAKTSDVVSVKDFGASGDGITDDTAAVQAAITAAYALGKPVVYFPAGTYFFPLGSASLAPGNGDLEFVGAGRYVSILKWEEGTTQTYDASGWKALFKQIGATLKGRLVFRDLQFRGTLLDDGGYVNTGGPALALNNYDSVIIERCRFYGIADMATQCESILNVEVTGCEFDCVMRDQVRFRSSFNVVVTGNHFRHSDDDSVALHQANYITGAGLVRRGLVVSNNTFEDTNGVALIGARQAVVSGNVFRRCKFGAVRIDRDTSEGVNPMYGIVVSNNVATDLLGRPPFTSPASAFISVTPNIPRGGTDATLIPGVNNPSTGAVIPPWDYFDNAIGDTASSFPAGYGVTIQGNICLRTLPAVASYSDWGFGEVMTNAGFDDPAIDDAALKPIAGISASTNIVGLSITGNQIMNVRRGVQISDDAVSASLIRHRIEGNLIYDAWEYGVVYFGNITNLTVHARIRGNDFILDPYLVSPGRTGSHGGWTLGYGYSIGISSGTGYGFIIEDNAFEQCYQPISGPFRPHLKNNIVRGQFFSLAWSTANYGVGTVPNGGDGYIIQQIVGDTQTASQSQYTGINGPKVTESAAIPSTGWYAIGDFVRCTAPDTVGIYGWVRLTTGTNHVSGTDWKTVTLT